MPAATVAMRADLAWLAFASSMDVYVPNPKHKEPWQRGRRGALCGEADGPALFSAAVAEPGKPNRRWATDGTRFFAAQSSRHRDAKGDLQWHGYPVEAMDVPTVIMRAWVAQDVVSRRASRGGGV